MKSLSLWVFTGVLTGLNWLTHAQPTYPMTPNNPTQFIAIERLADYAHASNPVKKIIHLALNLAQKNLNYQYGSADPKQGGMDCSGTVYYLLQQMNVRDFPRSSDKMYEYLWNTGRFHAVSGHSFQSFEFNKLRIGDLLFWSGTYQINRDPNISHVMLYLGKNDQGEPLMIGASNGRTYQGQAIHGVSVFDFKLPSPSSRSRFAGYSCLPNVNCA